MHASATCSGSFVRSVPGRLVHMLTSDSTNRNGRSAAASSTPVSATMALLKRQIVQPQPLPVRPERLEACPAQFGLQIQRAQVPATVQQLAAVEERQRMQVLGRAQRRLAPRQGCR